MKNSKNSGEPPSQSLARYCPMLVGRNSRGHWVARSQDGLCGGLFVNRTEALRFALFENGHRPDAVILVTGNLELALNDPASIREESVRTADLSHHSKTAGAPRRVTSSQDFLRSLPGAI